MGGLAWAPYSKTRSNIVVAGPVPGERYETMTLPILAPDPNNTKDIYFDKYTFYYGGNRGRGQVYPDGQLSNNNQYTASPRARSRPSTAWRLPSRSQMAALRSRQWVQELRSWYPQVRH